MVQWGKLPAALLYICLGVVAAVWLATSPLRASELAEAAPAAPVKPACFAHTDAEVSLRDMARRNPAWHCHGDGWDASWPVSFLLFDAESWEGGAAPTTFFTRISRYQRIDIAAVEAGGNVRTISHLERDGEPVAAGPVFTLEIPQVTSQTTAIVVRILSPHSAPMITEARLTADPEVTDWSMAEVVLLALIVGMLIIPLVFDLNFFVILRERFVLLHAGMVLTMIVYVASAGGLVPVAFDLSVRALAIATAVSWSTGVAISAFFLLAFLEDGALSEPMRKLMRIMAWWSLLGIGFFGLQLHATQAFDNDAYFIGFIPVIATYLACLVQALLRGSRAARFLAIAWLPIIAAATDRLLRGVGAYAGPSTLDQLLYLGLTLEVLIVALGVADRFVTIRRERDRAMAEAKLLSDLSERDPLTGLLNRRAIDIRFGDLRTDGYTTLAVLDLDHFKQVNDVHGHQTGDAVLKQVAQVLENAEDCFAVRMGGEEFVLMMRGDDSEERAERLRRRIPVVVAREVEELDSVVTASVGLVSVPLGAVPDLTFERLYRRADELLYEAKQGGRNLLASETITRGTQLPGGPQLQVVGAA